MKGIYAFKVKRADGKEGLWIVDAKNGAGSVEFGGKGEHKFPQKQLIFLNYFFLKRSTWLPNSHVR